MSIVDNNQSTTNKPTKFKIRISDDESVEFRPTATFAHVTSKQVLKIIAGASVDVTAENNRNKVNFKLVGKENLFGFVNYFDNDLDDESEKTEVDTVIADLQARLRDVKISDITSPLTEDQADKLISGL
jgi:hypothetical protein|tara:strand:+ start:1423 stop:1809 length:387 start_codon:yes stop_codon:yes gene_type:complete